VILGKGARCEGSGFARIAPARRQSRAVLQSAMSQANEERFMLTSPHLFMPRSSDAAHEMMRCRPACRRGYAINASPENTIAGGTLMMPAKIEPQAIGAPRARYASQVATESDVSPSDDKSECLATLAAQSVASRRHA